MAWIYGTVPRRSLTKSMNTRSFGSTCRPDGHSRWKVPQECVFVQHRDQAAVGQGIAHRVHRHEGQADIAQCERYPRFDGVGHHVHRKLLRRFIVGPVDRPRFQLAGGGKR